MWPCGKAPIPYSCELRDYFSSNIQTSIYFKGTVDNPYAWDDSYSIPAQSGDGVWQLDLGNDWHMNKLPESESYELRFRYMTEEWKIALDGLKLYLEKIFK